jgi:dockerin type I repeat protein
MATNRASSPMTSEHLHIPLVRSRWLWSAAIAACWFHAPLHSAAPLIYFTGDRGSADGDIWRTEAGSGKVDLLYSIGWDEGRPMMVSSFGGFLYWTTYYPGQLWRSGMAGQNPELLLDQGKETTTRAIQFREGKVYWANESLGAIYRASLDGTDVETVIHGFYDYTNGIWDFVIHGDRIYWTSWSDTDVKSIRSDGSDFQRIHVNGVNRAFSLRIYNDRLLLTDDGTDHRNRILSMQLDGEDVQTLVDDLDDLYSIDVFESRLYYAHLSLDNGLHSLIHSIPVEGGDPRLEMDAPEIQLWQIHVKAASADCNRNGIDDATDISTGASKDCNENGIPDSCDIASGRSQDLKNLGPDGIPDECQPTIFHRGDGNGDGDLDVSDAVCMIRYLFTGGAGGGMVVRCLEAADSNNDGVVDCSDAVFVFNYLFLGGDAPPSPGPPPHTCGPDSDPLGSMGNLGCDAYSRC